MNADAIVEEENSHLYTSSMIVPAEENHLTFSNKVNVSLSSSQRHNQNLLGSSNRSSNSQSTVKTQEATTSPRTIPYEYEPIMEHEQE